MSKLVPLPPDNASLEIMRLIEEQHRLLRDHCRIPNEILTKGRSGGKSFMAGVVQRAFARAAYGVLLPAALTYTSGEAALEQGDPPQPAPRAEGDQPASAKK